MLAEVPPDDEEAWRSEGCMLGGGAFVFASRLKEIDELQIFDHDRLALAKGRRSSLPILESALRHLDLVDPPGKTLRDAALADL